MPTRRPGRQQRIAYDETQISSPVPDVEARIGWLLAMSRLHNPDSSLHDGRRFADALGDAGFPASRSLLSRWESGSVPASYEAMTAYERVLALEPGRLTSAAGCVKESFPDTGSAAVRPRLDPSSRDFAVRLDELIDGAEAGTALARDWQVLGWHFAAAPMVHLRASTWRVVCGRLVSTLPRAAKVAYRQLSTAATAMAAIPRAQDFMVEAIAGYVSDPAVQVVDQPLALLERLPTREAARLVLEVLEKPQNPTVLRTGVHLASRKAVRGDFTAGELAELHMLVARAWRRDPVRAAEELAELVAGLPSSLRETLVESEARMGRRRLGYVVENAEDVPAEHARTVAARLAGAARSGARASGAYEDDRMLARLTREALFHRDTRRRHCAALLVSASPFAAAMTTALLARLADRADAAWLRARLATLVRMLCNDSHRARMLALVDDPVVAVAVPITEGLGHLSFDPTSDDVLRSALGSVWSPREQARLFALGMSGSPGLRDVVRSAETPQWQRSAARWWIDHGSSVRA